MREEEKLARDVYLNLYDKWNVPIFSNIATSEQEHTDAIKSLLTQYGVQDLNAGIANTTHSDIKTVYSNLLRGSNNHLSAFKTQLEK